MNKNIIIFIETLCREKNKKTANSQIITIRCLNYIELDIAIYPLGLLVTKSNYSGLMLVD